MSKRSLPRAAMDNRANQLNPQHAAYHSSRGQAPPAVATEPRPTPPPNETAEPKGSEGTPGK